MHSTLGTYMAGRRRLRGLTQAEVCKVVSVNPNTLRAWERDESTPSTTQLVKWADVLGLTDSERGDVAAIVLGPVDISGDGRP